MKPLTFALYFGTRSLFPGSLVAGARAEMKARLEALGYGTLMMDASATPYGAVESAADGAKYAKWLDQNRGKFDGVVLCLPNFGDETGAVAALRDARVPIFVQAYPDENDKMSPAERRDAFCGKLSVMDVFHQYGVPFTAFKPHVVAPASSVFEQNIAEFAAVCRVVGGMKNMVVGAIGARTTAFKTVRFDELALQKYGITTESLDLSEVIRRVRGLKDGDQAVNDRLQRLTGYTDCSAVPKPAMATLARLSVVFDQIVKEYGMHAMAVRCWLELEQELKVAPCVLAGMLNDDGVPFACEVDVCNAVTMYALNLASQKPAACLDWNNNYGEDDDKCILFHCGPVPQSLMAGKGKVIDHAILARVIGAGCAWGPNVGRIGPMEMTYASSKTEDGVLSFYLGQGRITEDPIAEDFFGCAGVAQIPKLQDLLHMIGERGYRHHVSLTPGCCASALREAFGRYLGYDVEPA